MPARVLPDWYLRSRLKMRQVLLLVALDEQRNMHRAAASLRMTQPAATRLLGGLERMLGMKLFERGPRGLVPNAYGESLIRHARAMLATLDHAREEMNALAEGAAGRIALGALLVAAPVLVPLALARFKRSHPHHTVLVQEGSATALLPALRRGELDLVVGRVSSDVPSEGLEFEAFYSEPMQVVARPGHRIARRRTLRLRDLADETWIVPAPDAPYRRRLDAAFRQAGVAPPRKLVESVSVAVNKMLVQRSDLLGVMPRTVAREYAALGLLRVLPLKLPPPSGPVGVITAGGRPLPPGGAELIQALREAARQRR
jgi:DNA-binding transcriptional LysR family regulator